jgi:hypothetical protein
VRSLGPLRWRETVLSANGDGHPVPVDVITQSEEV